MKLASPGFHVSLLLKVKDRPGQLYWNGFFLQTLRARILDFSGFFCRVRKLFYKFARGNSRMLCAAFPLHMVCGGESDLQSEYVNMCCSMRPAKFFGTVLYIGEGQSPYNGHQATVLGYQNTAQNLWTRGANAMVLHFPAGERMTPSNVIDTSRFDKIMTDMVEALTPRSRGMRSLGAATRGASMAPVFSFAHGIYHVVLSEDARAVGDALKTVPEDKRPDMTPDIFDWYAAMYPGYSLALCCFNNADAQQATPLLWWYENRQDQAWVAPAVDAHDGLPPNLSARVDVDHWLILGSNRYGEGGRIDDLLLPVYYQQKHEIPAHVRGLLPTGIAGQRFSGYEQNGDFLLDRRAFEAGRLEVRRGLLTVA